MSHIATAVTCSATGGCGKNAPLEGVPDQIAVEVVPLPGAASLHSDADRAVLSEDPATKPCIHSALPTIADSQRSSSISIPVLIEMSRRENYLRRDDATYQGWMKRLHGARASTNDYEGTSYHREVVYKEPFMSRDLLEHLQLQVLAEFGYFVVPSRWVDPTSVCRPTSKALGEFDENWSRPRSFYTPDNASEGDKEAAKALYYEFEEECTALANKSLALYELRTAGMQYPDVAEFQETIYFKYNRVGFERNCGGRVFPGREAPNCVLYDPPAAADTEAGVAVLARTTLHEILRRDFPEDLENNRALKAALVEAGVCEEQASRARFQCMPRFIITGSYT